jgi:dephospho-CoA kinase
MVIDKMVAMDGEEEEVVVAGKTLHVDLILEAMYMTTMTFDDTTMRQMVAEIQYQLVNYCMSVIHNNFSPTITDISRLLESEILNFYTEREILTRYMERSKLDEDSVVKNLLDWRFAQYC